MLTGIIVALSPVIVSFITGIVKKLPTFESIRGSRKPAIRLLGGVISLAYVVVGMWIQPGEVGAVDLTQALEVFGVVVMTWFGSLGVYSLSK